MSRGDQLLERDAEVSAIADALADARRSTGPLVLIEGQAGIGKSHLLCVAVRLGEQEGMRVLRARCRELERDFPFGVVLQLLEPALRAADEEETSRLFAGAAGLAAPLFQRSDVAESPAEDSAYAVVHGLHWLISNLASAREEDEIRPLVAAVDDVQWADRASLRFLDYLSQRLDELPIALVLALRPGAAGRNDDLVAELRGHRLARLLRPSPLSHSAIAVLVETALGRQPEEPFTRACWRATQGNPFLVSELVAELRRQGTEPVASAAAALEHLAPESVLRSVLVRLARLPRAATAVAQAIAVLDEEAAIRHVAAVAELDERATAELADVLEDAAIIRVGDRLSFVHPLIRTTIHHEIAPQARSDAHARAARVLSDEGVAAERVAAHLVLAQPRRDPWFAATLRSAAAHAMSRGDPGAAVRFLEHCLACPPPGELRAAVLRELALAEGRSGVPTAAQRLSEAVDLMDDPAERARAFASLGRLLFANGRHRDAAEAFDEGLRELAGRDADLARELEVGFIAAATMDATLRPQGLARLEPILRDPDLGRLPADRPQLAQVALRMSVAGEPAGAVLAMAERALEGDTLVDDLTAEGIALGLASSALLFIDELDVAERALDRAIEQAGRRGSVVAFATASYWRSWSLYHRGRIAGAIADAEQALDAQRYGWKAYVGAAAAIAAQAYVEADDPTAAEEAVTRGSVAPPDSSEHLLLLFARGRIDMLRGDATAAHEKFAGVGAGFTGPFYVGNPGLLPWRSEAAVALARSGDRAAARPLVEEELALARRVGARRPLGVALRASGVVARGDEGIRLLGEAVSVLEASPSRLDLARALVDLGAELRRAGRRGDARDPLARALEMAHGMGALALATRAHDELKAANVRPRRFALSGPASLTPAERRVAEMAAAGATNREIAQSLFVSIKTVEQHLGNAFQKLGIHSRKELPTVLAE